MSVGAKAGIRTRVTGSTGPDANRYTTLAINYYEFLLLPSANLKEEHS